MKTMDQLKKDVHAFVTESFRPSFGHLGNKYGSEPVWDKLKSLGSELWLDTGSICDAEKLFTKEFSALTTNNTLLNKEIQTGQYDDLILKIAELVKSYDLSQSEMMLETAFILNAWHGLRLVEKFDCFVSVEEHTDLANNLESAVEYAKRFHAICPERFIVKIPFTPAGLLATRKVSGEGIAVNHTLGFSARQNYAIARISKPAFVNVFLGRLNSFVAGNKLGDGKYVGEKATLASQRQISDLRKDFGIGTKQIGASFRAGEQVADLAGLDVMTIPPKVAAEFLEMDYSIEQISDKTEADYEAGVYPGVNIDAVRLSTLWDVGDELIKCIDRLEEERLDSFTSDDLIDFFGDHGCGDILVRWSDSEIKTSSEEGKIPDLKNWKDALASRKIGLDSLMNLAGLNSFKADQKAMDDKVRQVLTKK